MKLAVRRAFVSAKHYYRRKLRRVYPAGVFISNPTGGEIEGPLEVMFAGLLGALGGFFLGMLTGAFARVFTMNARKGSRGGMHWAAYGAGAGAMALALVELLD
jgi:hypothetical protein